MTNDEKYGEWDKQVKKAQEYNNKLLIEFEKYLKAKSLKPKTINKHINNVKFYVNTYLLYHEIIPIEKGALDIGDFLGNFFIRKTSWASKATIKGNITSLKKFYLFLNDIRKISSNKLNEMKELIKEEKSYWLEEFDNYWSDYESYW